MSSTMDLVRCRLGDETYAIERSSVASVHQAAELQSFNRNAIGVRAHADGVGVKQEIGWLSATLRVGDRTNRLPVDRRNNIPVHRLSDCLQTAIRRDDWQRGHVVVLHSSLGTQGYLVDSVSRVVAVPTDDVGPVPAALNDPTRRLLKAVVLFREAGQTDSLSLLLSAERLHRDAVPLPNERVLDTPVQLTDKTPKARRETSVHPTRLVVFPMSAQPHAGRVLLCGLSGAQIVEIVERRRIIRAPLAPAEIAGFILWRDRAVPVVNVGQCLGFSNELSCDRMIIVRHRDDLFALMAPQSVQARRFPLPHQPCATPDEWNSAAVRGAFQTNDEWIVFPNLSWRSHWPAACRSVAAT